MVKVYIVTLLSLILSFDATYALAEKGDNTADHTDPDFVVTLLGTGSPAPRIRRFSMSTLVEVGDKKFLFDAGRGSLVRLWQVGLQRGDLDAVFLTHLHSDHIMGLPDLLMTGWIMDALHYPSFPDKPFVIYGPKPINGRIGTKQTIKRIKNAFEADLYIREHDEKLQPKGVKIIAHNIGPGLVYQDSGIKITAFPVQHGPWAKPALGYRVDYGKRSVLLSGDTTYSPNEPLLKAAQGVDVLIHEVADANKSVLNTRIGEAIVHHHTLPQQAGKVFAQIKPRLAVYSHIVNLTHINTPEGLANDLTKKTRQTYQGSLLVGSDLTAIVIGRQAVNVQPPKLRLLPIAP